MVMKEKIHSPYDFRAVVLASPREGRKDRAFYLGMMVFYFSI